MYKRFFLLLLFVMNSPVAGICYQSVEFSLVSIRPSKPDGADYFQVTADSMIVRRTTALWLLAFAFHIPETKLVEGGPGWLDNDEYDLIAKVDASDQAAYAASSTDAKATLLQPVFAERFGLKWHFESRMVSEYALVVAKGSINGKNLRSAAQDTPVTWKITGHYEMDAKGMNMSDLCSILLSTEAQRVVVDETGLSGKYDFHLSWSREPGDLPAGAPTSDAPRIFAALAEQLGLRLIPKRVPVQALVIDHIERPTEN